MLVTVVIFITVYIRGVDFVLLFVNVSYADVNQSYTAII